MSYDAGPDVEGALKAYLQQHTALTATALGRHSWLAVADDNRTVFPRVIITRIGGGEDAGTAPLDSALVQLDVYGRVRALDEANTVRRALRVALAELTDVPFTATGKGRLLGVVVRDERRFPEPQAQDPGGEVGERPRYIITANVLCAVA